MPDAGTEGGKSKLSATMRIDIAPESLRSPARPGRSTRITTRRAKLAAQKKAGTAPLATEDFQQLLQSVYDAALITDMSGRIVDVNVRAVEFFLYEREEFVGLTIPEVICGTDDSLIANICSNLVNRFVLIEACYCATKDGAFFPAEIAVNNLRLSDEEYLCFFVRDITLRRETEEQLRIEHTAIQNSFSGIAITDLDPRIQYLNPAVCRMWGHEGDEELLGKDVRELWASGDESTEDLVALVSGPQESWIRETAATKRDGTRFDVQVTAAPLKDTDNQLMGLVFSFVDISDRKRADEATREAERHKVMFESLGAACHHLAQPATILVANLGLMQSQVQGQEQGLRNTMTSCVEAAETLSDILHRLNAVNEYRTTPYLEDRNNAEESRILEI